jgi:hypothetical protein
MGKKDKDKEQEINEMLLNETEPFDQARAEEPAVESLNPAPPVDPAPEAPAPGKTGPRGFGRPAVKPRRQRAADVAAACKIDGIVFAALKAAYAFGDDDLITAEELLARRKAWLHARADGKGEK